MVLEKSTARGPFWVLPDTAVYPWAWTNIPTTSWLKKNERRRKGQLCKHGASCSGSGGLGRGGFCGEGGRRGWEGAAGAARWLYPPPYPRGSAEPSHGKLGYKDLRFDRTIGKNLACELSADKDFSFWSTPFTPFGATSTTNFAVVSGTRQEENSLDQIWWFLGTMVCGEKLKSDN